MSSNISLKLQSSDIPGEEDFGIIGKVLASGSPIIGLGKGGLDTFGDYDVALYMKSQQRP